MKPSHALPCLIAAALLAATGAHAGGYTIPSVEAPIIAAPPSMDTDWSGAYLGGSIGYSFNGDDEVGLFLNQNGQEVGRRTGLGNLDLNGPTAELHAGYRWQRDRWVFGPEFSIETGNVEDRIGLTNPAITAESSVNFIASLGFKTGYLVQPQTMLYGVAGVTYGDFDMRLEAGGQSRTESYSANGYSLGLGAERRVNDRMSVFAEWQYREFDKRSVRYGDSADNIVTHATPSHQNLKLGVNFDF